MKHITINAYILFVVFVLTVALTGCKNHHFPPIPQPVNPERIQKFKSTKMFVIINNQPSKDKLLIGKTFGHRFYSSLHEYSDAAVKLLARELKKRGMTSADDAAKVLKLSVSYAQLVDKNYRYYCSVSMTVETDEGYNLDSKANHQSSSIQKVCGGAITVAITNILNDEKFINYLKE